MKLKSKTFLAVTIVMLLFFAVLAGCSGISGGKSSPAAAVTVTKTVTATVTVTPSPVVESPSPSPMLKEAGIEPVCPPDEAYNLAGDFLDIKKNPNEKYIREIAKKGYITGFKDNTFKPSAPVTRSVYVLWLYNASGKKSPLADPENPHFPDLPRSHWLYQVVEGMAQVGGFKGYPDNLFHPDSPLTRQDWCVMNCFFAADPQHVIDSVDTYPDYFKLNKYNDPTKVSMADRKFVEYACSVLWCEKTFGKALRKIPFKPEKPITRGEAAKWIFLFQKSLDIY